MAETAIHIRPPRILLLSFFIICGAAAIAALVAAAPSSLLGATFSFLAGVAVAPLLASPIEWAVHRYVYHRPTLPSLRFIYDVHHRIHHYVYFPTFRYVTGGPPRRIRIFGNDHDDAHESSLGNSLVHLAHFTFYLLLGVGTVWVPAWLLTHSIPFLVGIAIASVIVCELFVTVHDTIHRPGTHPLLERQRWFRFLDRHHYIHHVDTEANVNFLLPLADWLFGTMRRTMTELELERHGSWAAAKEHLVGRGEPAREALRDAGCTTRGASALEEASAAAAASS